MDNPDEDELENTVARSESCFDGFDGGCGSVVVAIFVDYHKSFGISLFLFVFCIPFLTYVVSSSVEVCCDYTIMQSKLLGF